MRERSLGGTDRAVSVVGLGSMPLAIQGRPEEKDAIAVVHAALAAGVNWVDVADSYCLDESDIGYGERLVAKAVRSSGREPESVLITTKAGYRRHDGGWQRDGRPEHLRSACERSLKALGVERIELFQLHGTDPAVYYPDSVGALAELRREGKIRHIGLCNVDVGHLEDAVKVAPIQSVQNRCNILERHAFDNGVVGFCERHNITFIAHSPVGGHRGHGELVGHPTLKAVAARRDASAYQVAIAWLLAQSTSLVVIPGASKPSSIESSARAAELTLTSDDLGELRAAFPPASGLLRTLADVRRRARHVIRNTRAKLRSS